MRILLVRHGEPDYDRDTLTEKGCREASLLAQAALSMCIDDCYVSPLGRARDTAARSMKVLGKEAQILDWLTEFPAKADLNMSKELSEAFPDSSKEDNRYELQNIIWDMVPSYWTEHPEYMDLNAWKQSAVAKSGDAVHIYESVCRELDLLLSSYGYMRKGRHYQVTRENTRTIACYCHFGIICALLSHLLNVSPFILWHGIALAPASVTEIVSEERQQGIASFRALRIGDISHLYAGQEPPSFAARFCEIYSNKEQRH